MAETPLAGAGVLVTRPAAQAGSFTKALEALGACVFAFPAIEIRPLPLDAGLTEQISAAGPVQKLLFISVNAIEYGLPALQQAAPGLLDTAQRIAIGQVSGEKLAAMGFAPDVMPPSPYNSETLLAQPAMQQVAGEQIMIVKGVGGRRKLAQELTARGAQVHEISVYERIRPEPDQAIFNAFMQAGHPVITVTSAETLENLFELLTPQQADWTRRIPAYYLPGERVAAAAQQLGIKPALIRLCDNATESAMLACLRDQPPI